MATTADPGTAGTHRSASARTLPWWAFGLANVVVVGVLSLASWWLVIDPAWSPLNSYPQPYTATLFWTIISVVWLAFNFGWLGPQRLPQPARGLVAMALSLAIGGTITFLLSHVWGHFDPTFAAAREGGAGYTTGNLAVLFAFFFYVTATVNWGHWPFAAAGQPYIGLGELGLLAIPTMVLYAVFMLPNLATWAVEGTALMSVPTVIGWFYCCVVAVVVTGVLTDNWPWRLAGSPGRVMAFSVVGNVVLGTVLYYVLLTIAKLLMGPANAAALGPAVTLHAAELGVCWVVWMVTWANAFGNWPLHMGLAATYAIRIGVTFVLGLITYPAYYFFFAGVVLHEPLVEGTSLYGDALGYLDLVVLWTLWYILFLGSFGLPRLRTLDEEVVLAEVGHVPQTEDPHGHAARH